MTRLRSLHHTLLVLVLIMMRNLNQIKANSTISISVLSSSRSETALAGNETALAETHLKPYSAASGARKWLSAR